MTPEEREHMYVLCARIAEEKDHTKILKLIGELNDLLERKLRRNAPKPDEA